jgi:hypothetical protein
MATRNSNGKSMNERKQIHSDGSIEYWRDVSGFEGSYRVSDRGGSEITSKGTEEWEWACPSERSGLEARSRREGVLGCESLLSK